jgi:hypothetical protein
MISESDDEGEHDGACLASISASASVHVSGATPLVVLLLLLLLQERIGYR